MRHGKAALAALLVGIILFLDAMAACFALHELIHKDVDKPGHECAVRGSHMENRNEVLCVVATFRIKIKLILTHVISINLQPICNPVTA